MSEVREAKPVKLFCAVTVSRGIELSELIDELETRIDRVDTRSPVYDFSFTDYYRKEMGIGLRKVFVGFERLIHPAVLPEMKLKTQIMETNWSKEGKRQVNLDPGYINSAKLVVASAKDFAHRIYLADGIYGDLQLQYRHKRFWPETWTFPDYQSELAFLFFNRLRERFIQQEKENGYEIQL